MSIRFVICCMVPGQCSFWTSAAFRTFVSSEIAWFRVYKGALLMHNMQINLEVLQFRSVPWKLDPRIVRGCTSTLVCLADCIQVIHNSAVRYHSLSTPSYDPGVGVITRKTG